MKMINIITCCTRLKSHITDLLLFPTSIEPLCTCSNVFCRCATFIFLKLPCYHISKVPCPSLSPVVDLTSPESMYGLGVRMAAVESLGFLATQLEALHPYVEPLIPPQRRTHLNQFYTSTVKATPEVCVGTVRC